MFNEIGIVFSIDDLGGGAYGAEAFKIFYRNLDPVKMNSFNIFDGDTQQTLYGSDNNYCIAVQSYDPDVIKYVEETMSKATDKGLAPLNSRFIHGNVTQKEPLVFSAHVTANLTYSIVEAQSGGPPLWGLTDEVKNKWSDKVIPVDEIINDSEHSEPDSLDNDLFNEFKSVQSDIKDDENKEESRDNINSTNNNIDYQINNNQPIPNQPSTNINQERKYPTKVIAAVVILVIFLIIGGIFVFGIFSEDDSYDYSVSYTSSSSSTHGNTANLDGCIVITDVTAYDDSAEYSWQYSYFVYANVKHVSDIPKDAYFEIEFLDSSDNVVDSMKMTMNEFLNGDNLDSTLEVEEYPLGEAFVDKKVDEVVVTLYDGDNDIITSASYIVSEHDYKND